MAKKARHDADEVKNAARGRWSEILVHLAGVPSEYLDGKGHPCPKCKDGTDRFSLAWPDEGGCLCRQCFPNKNSDGIAAIQWMTGKTFPDALGMVADYLGVKPHGRRKKTNSEPARPHATPQGLVRSLLPSMTRKYGNGVRCVASWNYGTFAVLRFDIPTAAGEKQKKEFRPIKRVPLGVEGTMGWQSGYPDGLRPLYRLPAIAAADSSLVTIHGGEKATDAAAAIGIVATTNAGGEQAIKKTDWSPLVRFSVAAIVIDNDEAGEKFGTAMAWMLRKQSPDQTIKIVRLPNLPAKGDVVEWIKAGGTKNDFLRVIGSLPAAEAKPVKLPGEVNEADDDPHRLAKVYLDQDCPYKEIVYWRGEYLCWDKYYRPVFGMDLRSDVTKSVKVEFDRIDIEKQDDDEFESADAGKKSDGEDKEKPKVRRVTRRLIGDVLNALDSIIKLSGSIDQQTWIDGTQRPNCVSVENCVLDLDAFVEKRDDWNLQHTPKWFSPIYLPYSVDVTCKECASPIWDGFIEKAIEGDQDRIATLQEWMGYCLTHDTSRQKFIMLEGDGGGGKSTFCAARIALLGRQNISSVPLEMFGDKFRLSTTLGKLANIAADCGELDKAAEGFLKTFTSGDRMQFEKKNQHPFEAMPTARLIMAANNRPRFSDRTSGLWRRMIVVPFNAKMDGPGRQYGMDKPEFWERSGELPGIFWWAVLGLHRLREQGEFTLSKISTEAINEYRMESNPARRFLADNCRAAESKTPCNDVYAAYAAWCKGKGYHPLSEAHFGKEVFRVFGHASKQRIGGRGDRFHVYSGLELMENETSESYL